jgi:hypothetical protein
MGVGAVTGADLIDGKSAAIAEKLLNNNREAAALKDFIALLMLTDH